MRILFIANDFPNPWLPTKGLFNLALVRALAKRHDVRVISPIPWVDELKARRRGLDRFNRQATRDGFTVDYPRYLYPPKLLRNQYGTFYRLSIRGAVRRALRTFHPDAVIGYWAHPDGEAAVHVARSIGVSGAIIVGGSDVLLITQDAARRRRVAAALAAADSVICVNRHLRQKVIELGVSADRAHAWSQGVDDLHFHLGDREAARALLGVPHDCRAVVWVGRMVPVKGLDVLLNACPILRSQSRDNPHVYLIGDGPLRNELSNQAASLGITDMIRFVGSQRPEQLGDWYRAADLTVLPSRSEGLPNVLRESHACGTPFVASDVGGIREIAEDADRLVPSENPQALADALAASLAQPARAAQSLRRPLSWDESADALVALLGPNPADEVDQVRAAAAVQGSIG
jgi:glycosyltransferase involved in cell wall biosynthesis